MGPSRLPVYLGAVLPRPQSHGEFLRGQSAKRRTQELCVTLADTCLHSELRFPHSVVSRYPQTLPGSSVPWSHVIDAEGHYRTQPHFVAPVLGVGGTTQAAVLTKIFVAPEVWRHWASLGGEWQYWLMVLCQLDQASVIREEGRSLS